MAAIVFTDAAIDDLRRLGPSVAPRILKKILLLETDAHAGRPLARDLATYRKLVVGDNTWRVVYRVDDSGEAEICEIWAAGARSDAEVYAEASARVEAAKTRQPELVGLAQVLERLRTLAGDAPIAAPTTAPNAVPDWLAERLVTTARMDRAVVAAMTEEAAVDAWTAYRMRPES